MIGIVTMEITVDSDTSPTAVSVSSPKRSEKIGPMAAAGALAAIAQAIRTGPRRFNSR